MKNLSKEEVLSAEFVGEEVPRSGVVDHKVNVSDKHTSGLPVDVEAIKRQMARALARF